MRKEEFPLSIADYRQSAATIDGPRHVAANAAAKMEVAAARNWR